jgi:hypothetical protein
MSLVRALAVATYLMTVFALVPAQATTFMNKECGQTIMSSNKLLNTALRNLMSLNYVSEALQAAKH